MGKVAEMTTEGTESNLLMSLFKLMDGARKPIDRRTSNAGNGVQKPSGAKDVRGGQLHVRYTCITGDTTKIITLREPRFAAPRVTCPGCSGVTIEGRGLRVKPICYWEIQEIR